MRYEAETFMAIEEIAKAIYEVTAEKAAAAMYNPITREMPEPIEFFRIPESEQELHREYARAAIKAIPFALGLGRV